MSSGRAENSGLQTAEVKLTNGVKDAGYTLTEMLVVIVIIGLIAAAVTPTVIGQLGRARAKTAKLQLETLSAGLEMIYADLGRYPTTEEGIGLLFEAPADLSGWAGPYVRGASSLKDPWGREVIYQAQPDGGYQIRTLGADGKPGGRGADQDQTVP